MRNKNKKAIAVRSTTIIEARFSLNGKQNDILDMLFVEIENDDILTYDLSVEKYKALYEKDTSNIYRDLKKAAKSFEGKGFYLVNPNKPNDEIYYPWFSKIHYKDNQGIISVDIHKDLKEKMYEEKIARVSYDIYYTLNFASNYSKRVYMYLKEFEDTHWRYDKIDSLVKKLECPASYKELKNLKRYALEPAKKEINATSDILIDYEVLKDGRTPVAIKFSINTKNEILAQKEDVCKQYDIVMRVDKDFIEAIVKEDLDSEEKLKLIKICDDLKYDETRFKSINEYFILNYESAKKYFYKTAKQQGHFPAILIDAITKDYTKGKVKTKTSTNKPIVNGKTKGHFNNFPQRQYDFDDLERKLLGWDKDEKK